MLADLVMEFEFGHCNGAMDMSIHDRDGLLLQDIKQHDHGNYRLSTKISLPTQLIIQLSNKNYRTDTKVDKHNSIINNKFIQLKSLSLGNLSFPQSTLIQLCSYKTDIDDLVRFDSFWDRNGTVSMDFFDKDFVEFHLHYHNIIKF